MPDPSKLAFFLGGHDLEMLTIRDLVSEISPERVFDKNLRWGAKASAYRAEIDDAVTSGVQPVLVELDDDVGVPGAYVVVDHHGSRAGATAPTSLHQVFDLLQFPRSRWTRWLELVAANDRGHIRELRRMGASEDEIQRIRTADRAAQGITESDERAGEKAIQQAQTFADGLLMVVELPHAHTAVVADRLEMHPDPPENLLVISPGEVNYYGPGLVIEALDSRYPGGWTGGSLPERGFWGRRPIPSDIVDFTASAIERVARTSRVQAQTPTLSVRR
ncbi:MAG TPA: hypothetical protein VLC46_18115 [Thermoanaerobaculia bacterium]|jgi:hypothetical protein|nr:hypothetical protein [Thermoanaerobaculia bacterium]